MVVDQLENLLLVSLKDKTSLQAINVLTLGSLQRGTGMIQKSGICGS
jgi:hypothetical protein